MTPKFPFPKGFTWGAATASYQIEGAARADGRQPSIWDVFCAEPGRIADGTSGEVACGHYERYRDDVAMMARMGLQAYRFSIAWPRAIGADGKLRPSGFDFYDRLVDELLAAGIEPMATCYHWDLPQFWQERGGWQARETVDRFAEFAGAAASALGDRVPKWCTLNEIPVAWIAGHVDGAHAPGLKLDERGSRAVCHHLLMAHGAALRAIRASAAKPVAIGLVHNPTPFVPFFEDDGQIAAARDAFRDANAWCLDPVFKGAYPADQLERLGDAAPPVQPGDLELIHEPGDYFGINLYSAWQPVHADLGVGRYEPHFPKTQMGWDITPDCLYWTARFLHERYAPASIVVTENGSAWPDEVDADGRVLDWARVEYLRGHLRGLHRAIAEGVPVDGYYAWSLMDNFEWSFGCQKRFGLVHVDYETLARTPKLSAEWYGKAIRGNGF